MGKWAPVLVIISLIALALFSVSSGAVALSVAAIILLALVHVTWLIVQSHRNNTSALQVSRDVATGLPNREAGQEAIETVLQHMQAHQLYVVALVKLSNMRELAAIYGTEVVEHVLLEAGRRLSAIVGLKTLSSLGGSQFLLLIEKKEATSIDDIAKCILEWLNQPFTVDSVDMIAECHIGFALSPEHGLIYSDLMRRASLALNHCGNEAKPYCVYVDGQDEVYFRKLQITARLQHAIASNGFEIRLQPQFALLEKAIVSAELLLGWKDDDMGPMSPEEFIPLAERSGDITAITRWVMRKAVELLQHWQENNKKIRLSINISPRDLLNEEFVDELLQLFRKGNVAEYLTIEITESALIARREVAIHRLMQLAKQGVHIAMDDYGTGYSSLLQLRRLPIHELKIDKVFIQNLENSIEDQTIVRSTIKMAHGLGVKVVAEGVESEATFQLLADMGCDIVQGHYVGDAVYLEHFDSLLK